MLPGPPIALRTFPQNDEIALFAEVYDNAGATPHKVDITTTVTTDEGKVMFKTDEVRDSADLGGKRGGYGYTTRDSDEGSGARQLRAEGRSEIAAEATRRRSRASCSSPWRRRGRRRRDDRARPGARDAVRAVAR